jgi:hypothetical protein
VTAAAVRLLVVIVVAALAPVALGQSPTGRTIAAASPRKTSFTDDLPCSACHTTTAWRAKGAGGGAQFDHATTGFPLTGEHTRASCVSCHQADRVIKRACTSCHEDFHRGRLSQSCDTCHSAAGWQVTRPLFIHRMTRFPLTGMHVLADCSECHLRASEHRWTDAPIDCFACHERDYRRPDLFPVHVGTAMSAPLPRDCSLCHRATAWVPAVQPASPMGAVSSALETAPPGHDARFPISIGVHRTASCDDCHASRAAPRAVRCIGCHAHDPARLTDQHRRQSAGGNRPIFGPAGTDGASCLSCHPGGARR